MTLELLDQMVRDRHGGEMLEYWKQNPMPAEDFVLARAGQEVANVLKVVRQNSSRPHGNTAANNREQSVQPASEFHASGQLHKWMYDRYSLRIQLERAGFVGVTTCAASESRIPDFNSYLLDLNKDGLIRKPDSLFMEGQK
jgi:YD repeat-containing protein